ncbi:MAG: hypothetical protein ACMUJM_25295 [bacterium]
MSALKLRICLGRPMGTAMVANRTRENRPSGMKTGAYGNVDVLDSKGKLRVFGIPLIKTRLGRGTRGTTVGAKNKATPELLLIYCARRISIQSADQNRRPLFCNARLRLENLFIRDKLLFCQRF